MLARGRPKNGENLFKTPQNLRPDFEGRGHFLRFSYKMAGRGLGDGFLRPPAAPGFAAFGEQGDVF